jgi:diguanylate cyclase (GGDEF)-like protein
MNNKNFRCDISFRIIGLAGFRRNPGSGKIRAVHDKPVGVTNRLKRNPATSVRQTRDEWGLAVFLVSPLLIGSVYFAWNRISPSALQRFSPAIMYAGLILSASCILIGYLSYTRVHNLKVFLLCHLTGMICLVHFAGPAAGLESLLPPPVVLSLLQVNLLFALLLPAYAKFRYVRLVTGILAAAELSILAGVMLHEASSRMVAHTLLDRVTVRWTMALWPVLVLPLSFLIMKRQFKLGGTLTGCSYFFTAGMLAEMGRTPRQPVVTLLLVAAMIYFIFGVMVHWFSRLEHRVSYDPLLRIHNRNFCSRIIQEQTRLRTTPPFCVAMVDIDHFKKVNDTHGHQAGDRVLIAVAQTVQREVQPGGVLCRYGGEELAIFFPGKTAGEVVTVMENCRASVGALKVRTGKKKSISVTISCGVSHRSRGSQSIVEVIEAADRALYRAKHSGRNRVESSRNIARDRAKRNTRNHLVISAAGSEP